VHKYRLNKKVLIFITTLVLLNNSVVVGGNAESLDLTDTKGNSWFNIEVSIQGGEAHFEWESEFSSTTVEIIGESVGTIRGQDEGELEATLNSADAVLDFTVKAERTIYGQEKLGSSPEEPVTIQYITSMSVDNPTSNNLRFGTTSASASGAAAKTYLRYQTFIPDPYVDAPPVECTPDVTKDYLFAGDDRNFDPASNDFKTRFQVTVDWVNSGNVTYSRAVGETRRYEADSQGNAKLGTVTTATASTAGMKLATHSKSSTLVHYELSHSVTNPMCSGTFADSIWYNTDVWIARSGAYTITNSFRRVPNHELYLKDSDEQNWTAIMQESYVDMNCLLKRISETIFCNKSRTFHETTR
jgi:hypothetical protein